MQVGGRTGGAGGQTFSGRIYLVRAYSSAIGAAKVRQNGKIDRIRYANALTWRGGEGVFGASGNWVDVDAVSEVPGLENAVDLPPGVSKITLGQDHVVASVQARNGCLVQSVPIDATFDMGGHTLTVVGAYQADGTYGFDGIRAARLCLTNGAFKAESIAIGARSDRIVNEKDGWIAQDKAISMGSGSLCVEGPGTTAATRQGLTMEGPFTYLRVAGGAELSCAGALKVYSTKRRKTSSDPYERAKVEVSGAGTMATVGSLYVHGDVDVAVSGGARIGISGSGADSLTLRTGSEIKFTLPENSAADALIATAGGMTVDDEDGGAADSVRLVIDDAAFKGPSQVLVECATDSTEAFQELVNSLSGSKRGRMLIADDGKKLIYRKLGFALIFR